MPRPQFRLRSLFILTAAFAIGLALGPRAAKVAWPAIERELRARRAKESAESANEVFNSRIRPSTPEEIESVKQMRLSLEADLAEFEAQPPTD